MTRSPLAMLAASMLAAATLATLLAAGCHAPNPTGPEEPQPVPVTPTTTPAPHASALTPDGPRP